MRATIPARKLALALTACAKAGGRDGSYSLYSATSAHGENLVVAEGASAAITRRVRTPAEVHDAGAINLDGMLALRYVRAAEADTALIDIEVEQDDGGAASLVLATPTGAARIAARILAPEHPEHPDHAQAASAEQWREIESQAPAGLAAPQNFSPLAAALRMAARHACPEVDATTALAALSGIQISLIESRIRIRGSDGKRLFETSLGIEEAAALSFAPDIHEAVLPRSTIDTLCDTLERAPARILATAAMLHVVSEAEDLDIRLIGLPYPAARVDPETIRGDAQIVIARTRLVLSLARAAATIEQDRRGGAVRIDRDADGVTLSSTSDRIATAERISGAGGATAFAVVNGRHLADAAMTLSGGEILFAVTIAGPVVISTPGDQHLRIVLATLR